MTERIIGYILLTAGILLMIFATIQIIFVFTGKAKPMKFFQTDTATTSTETRQPTLTDNQLLERLQSGDLSGILDGAGGSIPGINIINPETINQILNLMIFYFIMHFLLSLGYKLASLGVQMVRPVKVEIKQNKLASMLTPQEEETS